MPDTQATVTIIIPVYQMQSKQNNTWILPSMASRSGKERQERDVCDCILS